MPLDKLNNTLKEEIKDLEENKRLKAPERVISGYAAKEGEKGPRFMLADCADKKFIKMNSNNYLGLSQHPKLMEAEHNASKELGVNPGAVRFIDGTTKYHVELEKKLADFHNMGGAKVFSCAYMANLGVAAALMNKKTFVISDTLNHNSIARAIRFAGVNRENKAIFAHNDSTELAKIFDNIPEGIDRVIIVFDGIFSMRGDHAPIKEIVEIAKKNNDRFKDGVITIVDDSHGTAAYGKTGRGTPEICGEFGFDVITSTLGKAFGAEGGYAASSEEVIEIIRQKADTYIYTNPISPGMAAAAATSVGIVNSPEGEKLLSKVKENADYFRKRIQEVGYETIEGKHPIVPVLVRDIEKVRTIVKAMYDAGVLVTPIIPPVVPVGDETIRVQISAAHTKADLDYVLSIFEKFN